MKRKQPMMASAQACATKPRRLTMHLPANVVYILLFVCFYVFCAFVYGDIFSRAQQESFVVCDAEMMRHLTQKEWGTLYYWGRWLLLPYKWAWLGALVLSAMLTLATYLADKALRVRRKWCGVSALLPTMLLAWMVWRGTSLYYKNEPSLIVLLPIGLLLTTLVAWGVSCWLPERRENKDGSRGEWGAVVALGALLALCVTTRMVNENEILTARMQLKLLKGDFMGLIDDGLSAKNPTRSVAAYYAIGLQQNNEILTRLFDIPYHFPEHRLDIKEGSEEYGIFLADCNFYAGLFNASYRNCMDQIVMHGTRTYYLKRMVLCAIMNGEKDLANKYLRIIEIIPFEQEFVDAYRPMVDNPALIDNDASLCNARSIMPLEQKFEQNYRSPAFLGYNVGMLTGNNEALAPSIAACLYSKDLPNAIERAGQLKRLHLPIPLTVQEAIAIHGQKNPKIYSYFTEYSPSNKIPTIGLTNMRNFIIDIQQFYQEKYANENWQQKMVTDLKAGIPTDLRERLDKSWKGHYVYYYYCGNVKPKKEVVETSGGVN